MPQPVHFRRAALAALAALLALPAGAADSSAGAANRPPDFALHAVAGPNVRLSEHRGEVVVIAFWGSRCDTCRMQLAALNRIFTTYRPAGLQVFAVGVDDDPLRALEFARAQRVGFPLLLDPAKAVSRAWRVELLPTVAILDRGGMLRHVHRDYEAGDESLYTRELRELLNE
ncbi:MAG: TlpA family protein disulfide reductase [Gammaproteobacteria bacterium]|nr:TlpA family protein disulfide reductase [Gammaproteobacteria bacterium]